MMKRSKTSDLCKLETLRDVEGSNIYIKSVTLKRITYTCNVRKMSRMYNTAGAPDEFYPLASVRPGLQ